MPATTMLAQLEADGVVVDAREGRLRLDAPRGILSPERVAQARALKAEILDLLSTGAHRPPPAVCDTEPTPKSDPVPVADAASRSGPWSHCQYVRTTVDTRWHVTTSNDPFDLVTIPPNTVGYVVDLGAATCPLDDRERAALRQTLGRLRGEGKWGAIVWLKGRARCLEAGQFEHIPWEEAA